MNLLYDRDWVRHWLPKVKWSSSVCMNISKFRNVFSACCSKSVPYKSSTHCAYMWSSSVHRSLEVIKFVGHHHIHKWVSCGAAQSLGHVRDQLMMVVRGQTHTHWKTVMSVPRWRRHTRRNLISTEERRKTETTELSSQSDTKHGREEKKRSLEKTFAIDHTLHSGGFNGTEFIWSINQRSHNFGPNNCEPIVCVEVESFPCVLMAYIFYAHTIELKHIQKLS